MNFLAHLALSDRVPKVMVGNFIGDFVKGNGYQHYPPMIQRGILLHRSIDDFTDHNQATKKCSALLKEGYGRYAGVIVDVFFDHILASNWHSFYPDISLGDFVSFAHRVMNKHYFYLPSEVKGFLPFLISSRRLESYRSIDGVERALEIMVRHTSLPAKVSFAMEQLAEHHHLFHQNFTLLYSALQIHIDALDSEINGANLL